MEPEDLIRGILRHIGEDPTREGLVNTPKRVVKSWLEIFSGYSMSPKEILSTCFTEGACDELVILKGINFHSTCEHHMLPFIGTAGIGYLPNKKVVGISKLARLVDCFSKRLQIQEQMTQQIARAMEDNLEAHGVSVIISAHHQCMSCRGVGKQNTTMVTSAMRGIFRSSHSARAEVLSLLNS